MVETVDPPCRSAVVRIEPDDRLVVLARTIYVLDRGVGTGLDDGADDRPRFGESCLGQALYRHRTVFQGTSDAPVWSHLELSYFRDMVPDEAIFALVARPQPDGLRLLRAEILLTTPSAFILPCDWQGSAARPERQASLEYIQVDPACLGDYRDVMRGYCGPAAAKLVGAGRFGTFRAMETAAVLHRDPDLKVDWNQIHLCELDPAGFEGFGKEFEAALRDDPPDGAVPVDAFGDLDRMRTVPRWTFNDPVVEADTALVGEGRVEP